MKEYEIRTLLDLHDEVIDQEDKDAHQLLADFFQEVDLVLREVKSK